MEVLQSERTMIAGHSGRSDHLSASLADQRDGSTDMRRAAAHFPALLASQNQ